MIDQYDRRCWRLSDELESERHALMGEREKSSGLSSSLKVLEESSGRLESSNRDLTAEVNRLKEEVLEQSRREEALSTQKSTLEAEMSRLMKSRQELVDLEKGCVESVMSARFGAFVEKVGVFVGPRSRSALDSGRVSVIIRGR